jgi:hypothetical protein
MKMHDCKDVDALFYWERGGLLNYVLCAVHKSTPII